MPELPEVEICAQNLRRWVLGRTVEKVWADAGKPLRDIDKATFESGFKGRRIEAVERHGKQLFLRLDAGWTLLAHLGMTGKFVLADPSLASGAERAASDHAAPRPGTRLDLLLDDGRRVLFVDSRRFGRLRLLENADADAHPEVTKLGPDALAVCGDAGALAAAVGKSAQAIKVALMDQAKLAGVGNIYAAEALFLTGIDPWSPSRELSAAQLDALGLAIVDVMQQSLRHEAGDEIRYLQEADSENPFTVYGREGAPCPTCATEIKRAVQAARSTFWCPKCQKKPRGRPAKRPRRTKK